jgi:hypothetical protein
MNLTPITAADVLNNNASGSNYMIATQNFFQKDRFVILADVYRSMVSTAANQIPPVLVLKR